MSRHRQTFSVTRTLFENALDIRRFGSAALDLCMVADGRAELFYEARLSPWDLAAGVLLVKEAGGIVTQLNGEEIQLHRKSSILAGAPAAYDRAKTLLG